MCWILILIVVPVCTWMFYKLLEFFRKKEIEIGDDIHIRISNLTKIYDDDIRFVKEWKKRKRREGRIIESGGTVYDRNNIVNNFIWQVPLYGTTTWSLRN